jgi:hypothetical protein
MKRKIQVKLNYTRFQEDGKDNEIIVQEYFKRIKSGDIKELLELFSDDSVIHEPFSRSKCLLGKTEIEPFLKSVIMANEGIQYEIKIQKEKENHKNSVVALVTFRRQHMIMSKFTFGLENTDDFKLIKSLQIEFID